MIHTRSIARAFAALVFLCLPAASSGAVRTTGNAVSPNASTYDIELLESSPDQVRFRVRFAQPTWKSEAVSASSLRYPFWPGLSAIALPGEAAIPAAVVRVALPNQGRVTLEETPQNGERASGAVFPAVPYPTEDASFPVTAKQTAPTTAEAPPHHARLLKLGVERGLRIALVAVQPARRAEDGTRDIFWTESIEVTLHIDGAVRTRRVPPPRAVSKELSHAVLNPESIPAFINSAQTSAAMPSVWFDDGGGWLKIRVSRNGIYTLTRDSLAQAGVPVGTIDPSTFRLFSGPLVPELAWTTLGWRDTVSLGDTTQTSRWYHVSERPGFTTGFGEPGGMEETDLWVDGETDASFDAADRVVFYGLGPDNYRDRFGLAPAGEEYFENPYSDYTVYWLTWEGTFPGSPHRMSVADATPPLGSTPLAETLTRVHAEQRNSIYAPSLQAGGRRTETWFWDIVSSQATLYRALVNLPGLVPSTTVSGRVRLWGANQPEGTGDEALHHVQLDVNSTSVGTFQWGGPSSPEALSPQDIDYSGLPAAATSRFEFRVPPLTAGRFDIQYLAWIDVHYRRILALGGAPGELETEPGPADRVVHIAQIPSGTLDVFDVTSFRHPRRMTGVASAATVTGPGIELAVNDTGRVVIAVASRSIPQSPPSIELDETPTSWLRDTSQGLDEVIIAHDDFASEGERLAARRRVTLAGGQGRARVVTVSDVMDEFAWGMWDPVALRYFLEYVYRYYGVGTTPLTFALFLGDHTYDFRNRLATGNRDLVPSWEDNFDDLFLGINSGIVQYGSDDPLASFDGPDDPFLDLAIGRIPVSTVAAARAVIEDKILRSEEQPEFGPWRARVLLATDDICQFGATDPVGYDALAAAEAVDSLLPPEFDRAKVYQTEYGTQCTIVTKPQASDDFIALWNSGAWLVNYFGHGTETFYSDERLLNFDDIPSLTNIDRLPLLIASASKSAKFNLPNQTSITEALAISPTGGALAATGSTSNLTYSDVAFELNKRFVSGLFVSQAACPACPPVPVPVPAGLAFAEAKGFAATDTRKYVFFGDPAGLLPAAHLGNLSLSGPDSVARGALAKVDARLAPGAPPGDWLLEVRAEDAERSNQALGYKLPGDLMYRGDLRFAADSVNASFVVPFPAREGPDARIRGYAWTDNADALDALTPVTIAGSVDPSLDTQGPVVTFDSHPTEMVIGQTLAVVLEDPSGILLVASGQPALTLIVLDEQNNEAARLPLTEQFKYDIGSHTRGTARFPVPEGLASGSYTFKVTASDNFGNLAESSTPVHVSTSGPGLSFTSVYAYPNPLTTDTDVVFTLDRDVEVTLRIYSVSGRLVQKATLPGAPGRNGYHWDGHDQAGDPVANGVYLLQLSAQGQNDPVKHLERLVVLR